MDAESRMSSSIDQVLGPFHYRLLFWVTLALIGATAMTLARDNSGDSKYYQRAGEEFLAGEQFYYQKPGVPAFSYPPFMVLTYTPLCEIPPRWNRLIWNFGNHLLFWLTMEMLLRITVPVLAEEQRRLRLATLITAALVALLCCRYLLGPMIYQNHDWIVLFLCMAAIFAWSRSADLSAGLWAGLAAAAKATPLLFGFAFLCQRRWRAVLCMPMVILLATLLPDLIAANPDQPLWGLSWYEVFLAQVPIGEAPEVTGAWVKWNPLNQGLSGTLHRLFTPPPRGQWEGFYLISLPSAAIRAITLTLQLLVVAVLGFFLLRKTSYASVAQQRFHTLAQGSMVLCGMVLLSPMSSTQHFAAMFAAISVCVVHWYGHRSDWRMSLALVAMFGFHLSGMKDVFGHDLGNCFLIFGSTTWMSFLTFLTTGYVLEIRRREALPMSVSAPELVGMHKRREQILTTEAEI